MLRKIFFNLQYFSNPPWETGVSPPELLAHIETHPPGYALDLGCGTGTNVITLAKNNWRAVGVDFASRAIQLARKRARRAGVRAEFHVEDVVTLRKISGKFDLILDMGCFHSLPHKSRENYIANLERFLSSGGTYLLYAFLKNNPDVQSSGIDEQEIQKISQRFPLMHRKDGNERGIRPSTWLTFLNKPEA